MNETSDGDRRPASRNDPWTWEAMLDEFRRLGGIADNIRLGMTPYGRGLFPVDPAKPVKLHVPRHLLVPTDLLEAHGDRISVRPDADIDPALARFFERFEDAFSYGAGAAADCRAFLRVRAALPQAIRAHINEIMPANPARFAPPTDETVLRQFIETRSVAVNGSWAMMLLAELINHSPDHEKISSEHGVRVEGRFRDQVLIRYSLGDTWDMFMKDGSVVRQPMAFSIWFRCQAPGGRMIRVRREFGKVRRLNQLPSPKIEREDDAVVLSHLMLGNRDAPAMPRTICRQVAESENIGDPGTFFDLVAHANRSWFYGLLALLDEEDSKQAVPEPAQKAALSAMRRAAMLQLDALNFAVGSAAAR